MVSQEDVKLIDFGCARQLQDKTGEVGAIVGNVEFTGIFTYRLTDKLTDQHTKHDKVSSKIMVF